MKESRFLEFKREVTPSFLKTVSAYANYGTGEILFGVDDHGSTVGLTDPASTRLTIENSINDTIKPPPEFTIDVIEKKHGTIVALKVFESPDKPYLYRGKAYKRSDTADVEVERLELNRLVLEGQNLSFEELPAKRQDLTFSVLANVLKEQADVDDTDTDVLKTLSLYSSSEWYNNAAAILADSNDFAGVDIVRFGTDISEILDRSQYFGVSALTQFAGALEAYKRYYQYEKIEGILRNTIQLVPEEAFREAVANALIHRLWDSPSHIQISLEQNYITITSPGGLPVGITFDEYLKGRISVLRNPIIAQVFYRLNYVEVLGTGVARILRAYANASVQPRFSVSDNYVRVELPVIRGAENLSSEEASVQSLFKHGRVLSRKEVEKTLGISQAKAGRILAALIDKGLVFRKGSGRSTKYSAK